jgi:hypothetical protein
VRLRRDRLPRSGSASRFVPERSEPCSVLRARAKRAARQVGGAAGENRMAR